MPAQDRFPEIRRFPYPDMLVNFGFVNVDAMKSLPTVTLTTVALLAPAQF